MMIDIQFCRQLARLDERAALAALAALAAHPAVSVAVAAKLSRRSPQVIREAIAEGSLPAIGKYFKLITLSDLLAWSGRQAPFTAAELRAVGSRPTPKAPRLETAARTKTNATTSRRPSERRQFYDAPCNV